MTDPTTGVFTRRDAMNLKSTRITGPWIATAVLATVAIGGGTAVALTPSGTIRACVAHGSGTMYSRTHCRAHDRSVTWNATGPQGVPGARGPQGAPGTNGQGPGYSVYNDAGVALPADASEHAVATLTFPAGSGSAYYAMTAKVELGGVVSAHAGDCRLVAGANNDSSAAVVPVGLTPGVTLPLQVVAYRVAGDTAVLECSGEGAAMGAAEAKITAVQLTSLTDTSVTH